MKDKTGDINNGHSLLQRTAVDFIKKRPREAQRDEGNERNEENGNDERDKVGETVEMGRTTKGREKRAERESSGGGKKGGGSGRKEREGRRKDREKPREPLRKPRPDPLRGCN